MIVKTKEFDGVINRCVEALRKQNSDPMSLEQQASDYLQILMRERDQLFEAQPPAVSDDDIRWLVELASKSAWPHMGLGEKAFAEKRISSIRAALQPGGEDKPETAA